MYLSRIRFNTSSGAINILADTLRSGGYGSHQLLWQLFTDDAYRSFLFREDQILDGPLKGTPQYLVLSRTPPRDKNGVFLLETKPFAPRLAAGQRLGFSLRANPTVFSHGKRHDVLMHAKKQLPDRENVGLDEKAKVMEEAAINWLCNAMRTTSWGISIDVPPVILSQRQNQTIKTNSGQNISFTSVDYEGVLSVTDPERLITTIENGVGKARAFGCGLLLLRRL